MYQLRWGGRAAPVLACAAACVMIGCSDGSNPNGVRFDSAGGLHRSAAVSPVPGLVAAYGFSEASGTTTADASGNGNTGTLGSGVTHTTAGRFGGGLSFNGTGMVTIPNAASLLLTSAMTLEAWVNPTTVNAEWRDVIYKGNDNYYLMATSTHSPGAAGGGTFGGSPTTTEAFDKATLPVNTWTHLAVTYDGSTLRMYVNGAQVSSVAQTGSLATSSNPLKIGGDTFYEQFFQGTIDEVRIYNRALSAAEVLIDMNTPVDAVPPPPDTQPPTVTITSPTATGTYSTSTNTVTLGGTASDNVGVTQVTWANNAGGSGTATGTTSWTATGIALQSGSNVITVTARDAAGNAATATLTVTSSTSGAAPGLVAAYGFEETSGTTTADASGNNYTGTLGSGVTHTTAGRFGGGLSFNGSGMVTIPNAAALQLTSAMTLEAWVNPTAVTREWRDVIYKGNDNYYLMATSTHSPGAAGGGTFAGAPTTTEAFETTTLPVNTWTHLAVTYDGSALRMYVNGAQVSSVAQTGPMAISPHPLQLGGDTFYEQFFQGTIDEVRIYNRALSAAEVLSDMATPVRGGSPVAAPAPDTQAPTVSITSPTATGSYSTTASTVTIGGTASDNVGVTQVTWANNRGGSGTASGTTSWTASSIALQSGSNVITVTARDAAGNAATASLAVTVSTTPAARLTITTQPSSTVQSGVAFAQEPAIQLRDASNNAVSQSGVVVTTAIATGGGTLGGTTTATTNGSGVATFTNLSITGTAGARTLSFSASSLTGATSNTVTVSVPSTTACANEPTGLTNFNDQPWDQVPTTNPAQSTGWIDEDGRAASRLSIISDSTSIFPWTNHNVVAGLFAQGDPGGAGPFYVIRPFAATEQYSTLYFCVYMKHSANFNNTNGNAGTKFLWPAGDAVAGTQTYVTFDGPYMNVGINQQGGASREMYSNLGDTANASMYSRRGTWVVYEFLLKANTSNSSANGQMDIWINGVHTHHYTDVNWQMGSSRTWQSLAWNPTYGGGLNPVPANQWEYIDHIRIGGGP